jgi:hypothetical protein
MVDEYLYLMEHPVTDVDAKVELAAANALLRNRAWQDDCLAKNLSWRRWMEYKANQTADAFLRILGFRGNAHLSCYGNAVENSRNVAMKR